MWKTSLLIPPSSSISSDGFSAACTLIGVMLPSSEWDDLPLLLIGSGGFQLSYGCTTAIHRIGMCNVIDRNVRNTHIKKVSTNTNYADSGTFDFSLFKICLIIYLDDLCNG